MKDLNDVLLFVEVARHGSFSEAARRLQLQKSTLSRRLRVLEESLKVTLFRRTTRQVVLTPEGERYMEACRPHVEAIYQSLSMFESEKGELEGEVRMTAPIVLGQTLLPDILMDFLALHPRVQVDLLLEDRTVDLIAEKVDVAIRAGPLRDSTLKSQRLGQNRFSLFAATNFFKGRRTPQHPREVSEEKAVVFRRPAGDFPWLLFKGDAKVRIEPQTRVRVNHLETARIFCLEGVGLALLPDFLCQEEVRLRRLVRVCPDWCGEQSPVTMVYPQDAYPRRTVRAFIDFAAERISKMLRADV